MSRLQEYARHQQEKKTNKVVIPLVKDYLLGQWQNQKDRNPHVVHPSEMAKKDWCERATWYRIHGRPEPEEKFNFVMQTIFDEGHQIHDKWQTWLAGTGELWGNWECALCHEWIRGARKNLDTVMPGEDEDWPEGREYYCPYGIGEPLASMWEYREVYLESGPIQGHEDGAVLLGENSGQLIEFKSVGLGTLRADASDLLSRFYHKNLKLYDLDGIWKAMDRPLRSHVRQANVYLWLAKQMGLDFPKCSIVYEFKPNQQSREYVIPMSDSIVEPLIERAYLAAAGKKPRCPYGGCKKCESVEAQDGASESAGTGHGTPTRTANTTAANKRPALITRRRNGATRQRPDEAVPATDGVAEVSGDSGSTSGGRRKVLRQKARTIGEEL